MAEIFINPCFYFFTFSTFLGIFSPLLTKYSVCRVIFLFGFFFHGFVHAQSCDSSNECLLESRYKNDSVVCDITPFNTNNPPCYGHWSKFDDCSCVNPDARISSVGATYWCNSDSNWDEALYELDCYDPCYTDAGYNVIAVDPNGDSTNVVQDGDYVVYSCPENYTSVGTAKVTCNDGVWEDHDIFECNADCSLPIGYIFSEESFARITDGTNVAIECEKGLNTDTVVSECSNGTIEVDSCIYATTPSNADTTESSRTTETITTEIAPEVTTDVTTPSELRSTAATPPLPSTEVTKDVTTLYKSQSTVASSDIYSSEATTGIFTDNKSSTVTTKRLHTTDVATSSERQSTFEMSPLYSTDVTTPSKSHSTVVSTPLSSTPVTTDITNDVSTSLDTTDTTTVEFSSTTLTTSIITDQTTHRTTQSESTQEGTTVTVSTLASTFPTTDQDVSTELTSRLATSQSESTPASSLSYSTDKTTADKTTLFQTTDVPRSEVTSMFSTTSSTIEETTNPTMTTEDETTEVTGFLSTSETVSEETTTDSSSTEATSAIYSTDITSDVSTSLDTTDSTTVEFSSTTPTTSIITEEITNSTSDIASTAPTSEGGTSEVVVFSSTSETGNKETTDLPSTKLLFSTVVTNAVSTPLETTDVNTGGFSSSTSAHPILTDLPTDITSPLHTSKSNTILYSTSIPTSLVTTDGRCEKPDISADEHLSIEPNQAIYTNGSFITYICQVGHQLIGEPSAMCNNGHFQPADIPYCQVQCEIPYQDDNNEIRLTPYQAFYNNGSTISFSCVDGFEINGINSAVCVNGTFGISSYPTCEGSPCPRPVFADGNVEITPNKTEYSYDSEVTFSCSDGSTLIGTDTAKCNQGQFDISVEPSCVSSNINSCEALSVDDSVVVTPAADTYPINATIALSCTNPGKILRPSGQTTKICQGESRWNPSPVPSCINCQISEDCAGKENNICDQETKLCACPLGLELKGNECVETEAIVTTISLDTEFTASLLNQSSEEFAELQIEICTAFEITLTKQNTNVKVGFVSCFVISFSSGSVIADVVTVYDTRENVTSEQVTDIIVAESRNQPGENVTLPSLSVNITLDSKVTSEVHEVNYCDDSSFNVCDPTYGVCTYYGGNNYTCACNEKAFNADDISGISCQAVAELNRPNYALIIGLCIGTALGIILGILFLLVVIGSKLTERKTNEKRTNHDNYPSPALPVSTISGNIPSAGRTAEASEENASDIESITYVEGSIEEIRQDQQLQAMARTIQNMGELLAPIPRASPILEDSRGNVFRPSKRGETMY